MAIIDQIRSAQAYFCRKTMVSSITEIGQIYIYLFALVYALWTVKTIAKMIFVFQKKQNITSLQAKISLLKMGIKRSLQQKSNHALQSNGLDIKIIQEIKINYKELSKLDLNIPENYSELLAGLKKIYDLFSQTPLGLDHQMNQIQLEPEISHRAGDFENDFSNLFFWQTLFQTDQSIFVSIFASAF